MGELQTEPFQFTFNGFLKVAFQGSRITSDAGLILVRELDERLGLAGIIAAHLHDARHGRTTQFRLPDLLRQSVYSRLAGYEDLNDAQRLSNRSDLSSDRVADAVGPACSPDVHSALVRDRATDP